MRKTFKINILAASVLAVTSLASFAEETDNEGVNSSIDLSFRYRVETVTQEGFIEDAQASTMRTRATIKTNWVSKIDTVFEFDDVTEIGVNDYNSGAGTSPNRGQYPVIADPVGTELNQAFIRYSSGDSKVAIGRQRIIIANERYIGGVGWRQNEQTYDSVTYKTKLAGKVDFSYAYVFNVNRIFGESVDAGDHTHNTHLINADYKLAGSKSLNGKVSGYYFSIDNKTAAGLSNNTLGIRYAGKTDDLSYTLEFASQSGAANNPNNYDASYYLLQGRYKIDNASFGAGIEVLGGDTAGGQGFTTSLATLHAFQGWADVFLTTPVAGIKDMTLTGGYKIDGYKFKAIYHDFSTDEGGVSLGTELNMILTKKLTSKLSGLIKYASFDSDNESYRSRDRFWFSLLYKL